MPEFHQGEHLSTSRASWSAPPSCKTTMSRQKPQKPFGCTKYHASMILLGATLFWRTNSPSQIVSSHQLELTKIWVQVTKRRPIFLASSPTKTSLIAFEGWAENWLPTLSRCFFYVETLICHAALPPRNLENPWKSSTSQVDDLPDPWVPSGVQRHGKFHGLAAETTHAVELPHRSLQISNGSQKDGDKLWKQLKVY